MVFRTSGAGVVAAVSGRNRGGQNDTVKERASQESTRAERSSHEPRVELAFIVIFGGRHEDAMDFDPVDIAKGRTLFRGEYRLSHGSGQLSPYWTSERRRR